MCSFERWKTLANWILEAKNSFLEATLNCLYVGQIHSGSAVVVTRPNRIDTYRYVHYVKLTLLTHLWTFWNASQLPPVASVLNWKSLRFVLFYFLFLLSLWISVSIRKGAEINPMSGKKGTAPDLRVDKWASFVEEEQKKIYPLEGTLISSLSLAKW
jgi:hypothetical protein